MGGAGRVPWSSIERYAENHHLEEPRVLARMIWAMDDVYLQWLSEKQKTTNAN